MKYFVSTAICPANQQTLAELCAEHDMAEPVPIEEADLTKGYWIYDTDYGVFYCGYATHTVCMAALFAFKAGYNDIDRYFDDFPDMFKIGARFNDRQSKGQDLYLQYHTVAFLSGATDDNEVYTWSDETLPVGAESIIKASGLKLRFVKEM